MQSCGNFRIQIRKNLLGTFQAESRSPRSSRHDDHERGVRRHPGSQQIEAEIGGHGKWHRHPGRPKCQHLEDSFQKYGKNFPF